jgi:hypothetical protein
MSVTGTVTINQIAIAGTLNVDETTIVGTVNISSPNITGTYAPAGVQGVQGEPGSVPTEVIAHIARTDNPHQVNESQIPDGIDYTLLFNNSLI